MKSKHNFFGLSLSILTVIFCLFWTSGCFRETKEEPALKKWLDADGVFVSVKEKPLRIVSLGISIDDILTEVVPVERIAAVTYMADDPELSNTMEKSKQIKNRVQANVESIVALKPDLALVPSWQPKELVQALRDVGVTVYVCRTGEDVAQIKDSIREIAGVVGEAEEGEKLIAQMDAVLDEVSEKVSRVKENERLTVLRFSALGAGTFKAFDDICRHAGVKNAAAIVGLDQSQIMPKEQILILNPDIFLLPTWDSSKKTDLSQYKKELATDPALKNLKAIQNDRLYHVPDKYLYSTSQYIATAIKELALAAYPHLFNDNDTAKEAR